MMKLSNSKFKDYGLLILRIGVGLLLVLCGWPKMAGGAEVWGELGSAVSSLGVNFGYIFFGFVIACAEFWGGIFVILGVFFRLSCLLLTFSTLLIICNNLNQTTLCDVAFPVQMGVVFLSLILIGPGELCWGKLYKKIKNRK